jgi:hypothetical protein
MEKIEPSSSNVTRMSSVVDGQANTLKLLLTQVHFLHSANTKKYEGMTFYVVCKLRAEEWRSKPADNAGLDATFT